MNVNQQSYVVPTPKDRFLAKVPFENLESDNLVTVFCKAVEERPNDLAVIGEPGAESDLTFSELARGAAEIAAALHEGNKQQPREPGLIGLFVNPSVNMSLGIWGILWSGQGYVPMAPEYPDERLTYILRHSGVTQVVVESGLVERLRELAPPDVKIINIEHLLVDLGRDLRSAESIHPRPVGDGLAYVIYTSGSTGFPKGVEIQHSSVVHQIKWLADQRYLTPDVRILQKTPISFDAAQWEILAPAVGASTVAGHPGLYRDIEALVRKIHDAEVTHLQAVPTLLNALIQEDSFQALHGLRAVFSGGEALPVKLASSILTNMPWLKLVNLYGPTEVTINVTAQEVRATDLLRPNQMISIGRPVTDMRCHVLNDNLTPVAMGQAGELFISGPLLARGYRNAPVETKERFVELPSLENGRFYKTGDICAWQPDDGQ